MPDIARMRFRSAKNPTEEGWIALDSLGNLRVEPSDTLVETVAEIEQNAVETASRNTNIALIVLGGLALLIAGINWYSARARGRLRERLTNLRKAQLTPLEYSPEKGIKLVLDDGPMLRLELSWEPGEYNADEAENFIETFRRVSREQSMSTQEQKRDL